jgi:hypothetical protein
LKHTFQEKEKKRIRAVQKPTATKRKRKQRKKEKLVILLSFYLSFLLLCSWKQTNEPDHDASQAAADHALGQVANVGRLSVTGGTHHDDVGGHAGSERAVPLCARVARVDVPVSQHS